MGISKCPNLLKPLYKKKYYVIIKLCSSDFKIFILFKTVHVAWVKQTHNIASYLNVYHHIMIDAFKRENSCILVHSEVFLRPRKICYSLHLIECIMDNGEDGGGILTCIRDISKLSNYMCEKKISVTLPAKRSTS